MKALKKLMIAGLLSTGLYASGTNSVYIGFGAMNGSGTQTLETNGNIYSADYDMTGVGGKIGLIGKDNNRLEFAINKLNGSNDNGSDTYTGFEMSYLFAFLKGDFHPYLGLSVGYYVSENLKGYDDNGDETSVNALELGFSGGFLFGLTQNIELEIAYQYRHLNWNYSDITLYDDIGNAYVGMNFKF